MKNDDARLRFRISQNVHCIPFPLRGSKILNLTRCKTVEPSGSSGRQSVSTWNGREEGQDGPFGSGEGAESLRCSKILPRERLRREGIKETENGKQRGRSKACVKNR